MNGTQVELKIFNSPSLAQTSTSQAYCKTVFFACPLFRDLGDFAKITDCEWSKYRRYYYYCISSTSENANIKGAENNLIDRAKLTAAKSPKLWVLQYFTLS